MKALYIALCCIFSMNPVISQNSKTEYAAFVKTADSLYSLKEYKKSGISYSNAFKTMSGKGKINDRYNAARSWAMANVPDSAFGNLYKIAKKRFLTNPDSLTKQVDFQSLHKDKRWEQLVDLVKLNGLYELPEGWKIAGSRRLDYIMGIDKGSGKEGNNAATIRSFEEKIVGFGTLMQQFDATKYLGKRIRMTGLLKTKNVAEWAGLWMRVDGTSKKPLSFDNMSNRKIKETTGWTKYEIVLDVPANATNIAFGGLLHGTGQIWFDDLKFEVVDNSVPVTGKSSLEPVNLNFEE